MDHGSSKWGRSKIGGEHTISMNLWNLSNLFVKWGRYVSELRNEPSTYVTMTKEAAKFRLVRRFLAFFKLFVFPWLTSRFLLYDLTKVLDCVSGEAVFADFQGDSGLFKGAKDFVSMFDVLLDGILVYDEIINIYQTGFPVKSVQYMIQGALVKLKGIRVYWYEPVWRVNVVLCLSSGLMGTFEYPENVSRVENTFARPI